MCPRCGKKTRAAALCPICQAVRRRTAKRLQQCGITVDVAGGAWWAWDRVGNILDGPCELGTQVIDAVNLEEDEMKETK